MEHEEWVASQFEWHRARLRAVAYRVLGSTSEADDAVQEAWIRLSRADTSRVDNLGRWLTTVVARVSLDMLRSRKSRREDSLEDTIVVTGPNPEQEAVMADSLGVALLVVLETLSPAERVAFVLHDMFAMPFDEIAPIVGRSEPATRQLASRARRRVQGANAEGVVDLGRRREIVAAFLAASRGGDFAALLALLDPEVVLRADAAAVQIGAGEEIHGAQEVARTFAGRARVAQPALVEGSPGLLWASGGKPRIAFAFSFANDRIVAIELIGDPERLANTELA